MTAIEISDFIIDRLNVDKSHNPVQPTMGRADILYDNEKELFWIVRNEIARSSKDSTDFKGNFIGTSPGRPETSPEDNGYQVISRNSKLVGHLIKGFSNKSNYIEPSGVEANILINSLSFYEPVIFPEIDALNGHIKTSQDELTFRSLIGERNKLLQKVKLVRELETVSEIDKEELLEQIQKIDEELLKLKEKRKRHIIDSSILRDQPILDNLQEEIKRSKILNGSLILTGGPGTGKTTSLIQRINFLISNTIEEYKSHLTPSDKELLFDKSKSWIFFSPSELLRHYLKNVLVNENLNADDDRVVVWEQQRRKLFSYFGLINPETQRPFQATQNEYRFFKISSDDLKTIIKSFEDYFLNKQNDKINRILEVVEGSTVDFTYKDDLLKELIRFGNIKSLNEAITYFEKVKNQFYDIIKKKIDESDSLFDRLIADIQIKIENSEQLRIELESHIDETRNAFEEEVDDPLEDYQEDNSTKTAEVNYKKEIFGLLKKLIRKVFLMSVDKQIKLNKNDKIVFDKIKDFVHPEEHNELIKDIFLKKYFYKVLRGFEINILNEFPTTYKFFRKSKLIDYDIFTKEGRENIEKNIAIGNKKIHREEMDLILLLLFKMLHDLYKNNLALFNESKHNYINEFKNNSKVVIAIDEATDFSILELSCITYMSFPKFRCVSLCGDVMQRIEDKGIEDWDEYIDMFDGTEIGNLEKSYRQTSHLIEIAKKIYLKNTNKELSIIPAYPHDENDPKPLIYKSSVVDDKINWLSERIHEIRSQYGTRIPSIAIFFSDDSKLIDYEIQLNKKEILADNDIKVKACMNGEVLGDAQNVRLFNIKYIKGLEFEAVFYVDLDKIDEGYSNLIDRYIYVGVSRASFYLGITLEKRFPDGLEYLSEHFEEGNWK